MSGWRNCNTSPTVCSFYRLLYDWYAIITSLSKKYYDTVIEIFVIFMIIEKLSSKCTSFNNEEIMQLGERTGNITCYKYIGRLFTAGSTLSAKIVNRSPQANTPRRRLSRHMSISFSVLVILNLISGKNTYDEFSESSSVSCRDIAYTKTIQNKVSYKVKY